MAIINPSLAAAANKTSTATDEVLNYEVDRTFALTKVDMSQLYRMLIVANTVLWVAYLLGMMK